MTAPEDLYLTIPVVEFDALHQRIRDLEAELKLAVAANRTMIEGQDLQAEEIERLKVERDRYFDWADAARADVANKGVETERLRAAGLELAALSAMESVKLEDAEREIGRLRAALNHKTMGDCHADDGTHHSGCHGWEKMRDEEVERLRAALATLKEWASAESVER